MRHATTFINENFVHLSTEQEFLELSEESLSTLLQSDNITVPDEQYVFEAFVVWVMFDKESRIKCVRKF